MSGEKEHKLFRLKMLPHLLSHGDYRKLDEKTMMKKEKVQPLPTFENDTVSFNLHHHHLVTKNEF